MTAVAADRRDDGGVLIFPQSSRSNGTSMSNMSFEDSWNDFSKSRDVTPQKPTRCKTRRRSSMIETSSNHGFGVSTTDGFGASTAGGFGSSTTDGFGASTTDGFNTSFPDHFGSDVFGSDVMATDPWGDNSASLHKSYSASASATSRTMGITSDSSDGEEVFETSFTGDFPATDQGTMALRDHNDEGKVERSRGRGRSVPRRDNSGGQRPRPRSSSAVRMVPRVLTNEEVLAKRRDRSRSKSTGRSYRSKPSFVARGTDRGRSDSDSGSRRGRSLSVPRDDGFNDRRTETKQRISSSNHSMKADQRQRSRSRGAVERRSRNVDKDDATIKSFAEDLEAPVKDLQGEDKQRKARVEDKPKKEKADKTPKKPGKKPSKKRSLKGPKDKSLKPSKARSKSPRERSLKGSKDRSLKVSKDMSLKGSKDKTSKSTKGSKDKAPKPTRSRSKSPKTPKARSKSPKDLRARSKSPKAARARCKSPKSPKARSKSPKISRARSKSPKDPRARSKSPKSSRGRSPKTPCDPSRKNSSASKTGSKKSSSKKQSDKDSSKKKSMKLFANPLPTKSYLSRGTQKRLKKKVSTEIDKRQINIKTSLANLLSDDELEGSAEFNQCINGSEHSVSRRRHSMLGATPSFNSADDNSYNSYTSFSKPKSVESLIDDRSRRSQHRAARQMRRNSSYGT